MIYIINVTDVDAETLRVAYEEHKDKILPGTRVIFVCNDIDLSKYENTAFSSQEVCDVLNEATEKEREEAQINADYKRLHTFLEELTALMEKHKVEWYAYDQYDNEEDYECTDYGFHTGHGTVALPDVIEKGVGAVKP